MSADPVATRDDDFAGIRVSRTVPSWALFTAVIGFVIQFVALQLGQTRQEERIVDLSKKIAEQSVSIKEVALRVDSISDKAQEVRFKAANTDYRIEDLERRLNAVEQARKRP
jgi:uncharacterized coiled-coil protein SlyX